MPRPVKKKTYDWMASVHIMQWNNVCRSELLDNINIGHLDWSEDALVVLVNRSKKNQEGTSRNMGLLGGMKTVKLFANPSSPHLCPVLSNAVYFFSKRVMNLNPDSKYFSGNDQKHRYGSILKTVLADITVHD